MTSVNETTRETDLRAQALAARLRGARQRGRDSAVPSIPRRPDGTPPPPSFAQERLWFMDQFMPDSTAYTVPQVIRLTGPVDGARLARAFDRVVARHESVRMRFPAGSDGVPAVAVGDGSDIALDQRELDSAGTDEWIRELTGAAFDIATGPLIRASLITRGPDDHVLVIVHHHIVSDGWSIELFLRELLAGYAEDGGVATEPAVRYGDFAAWQRAQYRGEVRDRDLAHWQRRLAGVPPLDLPTDRPRPATPATRGAGHGIALDAATTRALLELGARHGATPYMTLLAAYQAVLFRWTGQDDFAVGSTVAGRTRPELEGLVGLFANVLALRADLSGGVGFGALLDRVRDRFLDDLAHQEMPLEQLVGALGQVRDPSRTPIFQTTFTMLNYDRAATDGAGPAVEYHPFEITATRFDIELYLRETPDGLHGFLSYRTDLFDAATIERLTVLFGRLVAAVVAGPDVPLDALDLLDDAERQLVLADWNDTALDIGPARTLPDLIGERIAAAPDAVAVVSGSDTLTYRQLGARAQRLAQRLRTAGVGPDTIVAVCAERSADLVPALLGVLLAGGAYLPLDPDHPADRLAYMLADATPAVLLFQRATRTKLPPGACDGDRAWSLDDPGTWAGDGTPLPPVAGPDDAAYVIYTSGSTGRPKGVVNTHRGIHNRLDWMQRAYPLGPDDVVLQKTPTSFDVSVWELFWPLIAGARLVLAKPGGHKDAGYLRDLIARAGVTTVHFVPSMLAVFLAEDGLDACASLCRIICSGEELPADLARRALARLDCELHNLYGPTEAAIDVTAHAVTRDNAAGAARIPIGRPIQNTRIYLLDGYGRPVPVGFPGELYIAGTGVARGYLNRPELTAERFTPERYGPADGHMYATGDLARYRPDGTIEYLGRRDGQVKLHGVRIELGEVEAALRELDGVREAAATVREDRPGDRRLVAYLVADALPEPAVLREELRRTLPDSMVPSAYVRLDAVPLSPSGKLDRRALPAPTFSTSTSRVEPETDLERAVAAVWAEILDIAPPGIDDDFFDLGGHSLLGIRVIARLRRELPGPAGTVTVMDLFQRPTVRRLAALLAAPAGARDPGRVLHRLTPERSGVTATLVCVPYGGGSAVVYQPLADALPADHALYAVAGTGAEMGREGQRAAFDELVAAAVAEIQERIDGPVIVYGHCGVGGALAVALARALEESGRQVDAVYAGAVFPFARPAGPVTRLMTRLERLSSDRRYRDWLVSLGVSMDDVDPAQARELIGQMRQESLDAEEYFTSLLRDGATGLRAPVVSVVGERDDITNYYAERFREWHFLTGETRLVVLDEAGHYFLKFRADELARIVTTAHRGPEHDAGTWRLAGISHRGAVEATPSNGPAPSMSRFLAVAAGQLVSMTGTALTEFALPLWLYLRTGSLLQLAVLASLGLVPGLIVAPLAGAVVDRWPRRTVMITADCVAGAIQAVMLVLLITGHLTHPVIYSLITAMSATLTFQRIAYSAAVPQLAPKRFLGHANGLVQAGSGIAQFAVPVLATAVLATVGLRGILFIDVGSYVVAVAVTAALRFPPLLGWQRRESVGAEIRAGFRLAMGHKGFRAMLAFFALTNLLLGPLFIMFQPLVLSFAHLSDLAEVSVAGGFGIALGGVLMAVWGGPTRRRMRGVLVAYLVLTAACLVTGVRAAIPVIAAGVFGMFLALTVMNTIYATIIQVKVPARFHGRIFALNTVFAWGTMPIGFILLGPGAAHLFQAALNPGGVLHGSVGQLIGTGPGRGIGLTYITFALLLALGVLVAGRIPALARFDREVPDARPDDLVGLEALRDRVV